MRYVFAGSSGRAVSLVIRSMKSANFWYSSSSREAPETSKDPHGVVHPAQYRLPKLM